MSARLRFFFDYSSPFAYLASTQVERIAARHGAALIWEPFLLGGLFRSIGTPDVPLFGMPGAKQRYMRAEMDRWADHWGVPFHFPTRFPMNTVTALRMTLAAGDAPASAKLVHCFFRGLWVDDADLADGATLATLARAAGLDGEQLLAATADTAVKTALREATERAERAGVCGAPSFLVELGAEPGVLFWGQDRFEFVEKALDGWRPRTG
jgi:2-hydroxychromene-2-carboxylate isomerase